MCRDNGLRCKCSDKPIELCEQLERELNEATTQLHAWHETFGTNQLTHALARLEAAEKTRRRDA